MKKILLNLILVIAVATGLSVTLTSCDATWEPDYPTGWDNSFNDSRLDGYWQLVQMNSVQISSRDANWLFFNGSGRGVYYYYLNSRPYTELTRYWCQEADYGASRYQINLKYENGDASTMNYWFEGRNVLWMQWRNQSGLQTYIYNRVSRPPF